MITKGMLNDIQAEFSSVDNLARALEVMVDAVDEGATGLRRRHLDALIGVSDALAAQLTVAQDAFDALFVALREGKEGEDAASAGSTPVARKYLEWKACLNDWEADMKRDGSDKNGDRWQRACYGHADAILDIPSRGAMDFVYKLMAYTFEGEHSVNDTARGSELWAEARTLIGGAQ
ncbi:MAG: hypothetical protein Q4615_14245 [Paracoccus aminovorans]|nr:hypothetical protein [Paracoccus aminovorans]